MFLQFPVESPSLQFGITIRAWSLIFAARAFAASKDALKAMDLFTTRCRQGTLRVHTPSAHYQEASYAADQKLKCSLVCYRTGIASLPLELLLCLRDAIIDLALCDAEQEYLSDVKAAHKLRHGTDNYISFSHCLYSARHGRLDDLCRSCATGLVLLRTDYKAIDCLLSRYSLSLVLSNIKTPLLLSPPYYRKEPQPWVIALPTHHSQQISRSYSYLPLHTPSLQEPTPLSTEISFFSPSFMRITSADIMRFRDLVRTWRIVIVEVCGTVASRGTESAFMKSRCSPKFGVPGAILDMEAMHLLQSRSSMGHCEPRWMLLNPNRHLD